jgi:hypothetical protein
MQRQFKSRFILSLAIAFAALSISGLNGDHFSNASRGNRSPANAVDTMASMPVLNPSTGSKSVPNISSFFQTNTTSLLGLSQLSSRIQDQMNQSVAGQKVWNGVGALPGAADFNPTPPSFDLSSACSIVPMTFYDVYLPDVTMPTLWCGAISNRTQPATSSGAPSGGATISPGASAGLAI